MTPLWTRLRPGVVLLGSLLVGGVFVVAGVLKGLDVDGFARDITLHGILGPALSSILARVLVPFEIVVGTAVIIGYRRRLGLLLLILTLVVFTAATAWAWSQGNTEGCGCFGRFASRTPLSVILEDLALTVVGVLAWLAAGTRKAPDRERGLRWRAALVAGLGAASTAFTLASPYLPIDDYATALRPGVLLQDLGLAQIAGDLAEGERLLVILDLDQEATRQAVVSLNALAERPGSPPITGLTSGDEEKRAEFFWTAAPAFPILEVPAADLRRLYRRAPRSFRVHNGAVLQVWEGIPPAEVLAP